METNNPPLPIGTMVRPWGMVSAITSRGGERYYLFTDPDGCRDVSLMPADLVERIYLMQSADSASERQEGK